MPPNLQYVPITDEEELEQRLSEPSAALVDLMTRLDGDIMVLGVAGKMGITLARMAVRAAQMAGVEKRVVGVSRFSDPEARDRLDSCGIETVACDLLDAAQVGGLEQLPNVIYMAGRKFGTEGAEDLTWAMNAIMPTNVARHFADSRIVAFSTGCVYPLVSILSGGSTEASPCDPVGEYAMSCLARERVFSYHSGLLGTPVCLFRLNYAIDLRYGVLHDIGRCILDGRPVQLGMPVFNCIWQADANDRALRCLEYCGSPAVPINVTGPETIPVRWAAAELAWRMDRDVTFAGEESTLAYQSNATHSFGLFGYPRVSLDEMLDWTAAWLLEGGASLGKPTHFEVSDGKY